MKEIIEQLKTAANKQAELKAIEAKEQTFKAQLLKELQNVN